MITIEDMENINEYYKRKFVNSNCFITTDGENIFLMQGNSCSGEIHIVKQINLKYVSSYIDMKNWVK